MTIFLIRHGRTLANEQHLYCGSTDLPLSRAGREALANRPPIDVGTAHFITSGMRRCNETLAILFGDVPYEVVRDFREIDFGAFEMKSYEMLKDEPAYQTWLSRDPVIWISSTAGWVVSHAPARASPVTMRSASMAISGARA